MKNLVNREELEAAEKRYAVVQSALIGLMDHLGVTVESLPVDLQARINESEMRNAGHDWVPKEKVGELMKALLYVWDECECGYIVDGDSKECGLCGGKGSHYAGCFQASIEAGINAAREMGMEEDGR